jgi:hypothetical protein
MTMHVRRLRIGSTVNITAALLGLHHLLHDDRHPRIGEYGLLRAIEQRAR